MGDLRYRAAVLCEQFSPRGPIRVTMYGEGETEQQALSDAQVLIKRRGMKQISYTIEDQGPPSPWIKTGEENV